MVFRTGKEVYNKVSKKEHDKEERLKTAECDLETEMENDPSPSRDVLDLIVTCKPRVPYPQASDAPFPSKKDKQRNDILDSFKQVKVNLPLFKAIK